MPYDSRMHGYCTRCKARGGPGRDKCTELCSIAKEYVSKGYVGQQEYLPDISIEHWASLLNEWPNRDMSRLNSETRKILILLLYRDGKDKRDIARHVECDEKYIREVIQKWTLKIQVRSKFAPKYALLRNK